MEQLSGWAVGIPFAGRAYAGVTCCFYSGKRILQETRLSPCDVFHGYRTRARARLAGRRERGPNGFVRMATPLDDHPPYTFYGWEAPACIGGGCAGLDYPYGLADVFSVRLVLRRTRALLEDDALCFHYKVGRPALRGAVGGMRLVREKIWRPVPPELLQLERRMTRDGRFFDVRVTWRGEG